MSMTTSASLLAKDRRTAAGASESPAAINVAAVLPELTALSQ